MLSFGTLFSGAGLLDIGFTQAGMQHSWGIEFNDRIADVARNNGFNVLTGDVTTYDFSPLEPIDWLHASPPCVRASSLANRYKRPTASEIDLDISLANAVREAISHFKPLVFSLENVPAYTKFQSFSRIKDTLRDNGYELEYDTLISGDYKVPQTRKRLILIATQYTKPKLPIPSISRVYWNNILDETCYEPVDYRKLKALSFLIDNGAISDNQLVNSSGLFINYARKTFTNTIYSENELISALSTSGGIYLWKGRQMYALNKLGLCRLQTVPDTYSVPITKAIGNGVPCALAKSIAGTMLNELNKKG